MSDDGLRSAVEALVKRGEEHEDVVAKQRKMRTAIYDAVEAMFRRVGVRLRSVCNGVVARTYWDPPSAPFLALSFGGREQARVVWDVRGPGNDLGGVGRDVHGLDAVVTVDRFPQGVCPILAVLGYVLDEDGWYAVVFDRPLDGRSDEQVKARYVAKTPRDPILTVGDALKRLAGEPDEEDA